MSSTLLSLPNELLGPIFTLAAESTISNLVHDPVTLISLCLVSRRVREIAQPLLYHEVNFCADLDVKRFLSGCRQGGRGGMVQKLTLAEVTAEAVHKVIGSCCQVEGFILLAIREKVNLRAFRFSPKLRYLEICDLDFTMSRPALFPILTSLRVTQIDVKPYLLGNLLSPDSAPSLRHLSVDYSPYLLYLLLDYPVLLCRLRILALLDDDEDLMEEVADLAPSSVTVLWRAPFEASALPLHSALRHSNVQHLQISNTVCSLLMIHPREYQASLNALIDWISDIPLPADGENLLAPAFSPAAESSTTALRSLCLPNTGFLAPSNADECTPLRKKLARVCALRGVALHHSDGEYYRSPLFARLCDGGPL